MFAQIQDFLAAATRPPEPTRVLTTILLAEGISRPSALAAIQSHGGVLRTHTAERVLATFDAPGRAIRCALALRDPAPTRGRRLRAGIHTGEVDLVGDQISGPSLSIAEAVCRPRPGRRNPRVPYRQGPSRRIWNRTHGPGLAPAHHLR